VKWGEVLSARLLALPGVPAWLDERVFDSRVRVSVEDLRDGRI
jgi:hypothetical protein